MFPIPSLPCPDLLHTEFSLYQINGIVILIRCYALKFHTSSLEESALWRATTGLQAIDHKLLKVFDVQAVTEDLRFNGFD